MTNGQLDYGNSPRATPLIHEDLVFLQGAFGQLHCVRLATGVIVWKKDLRQEFGANDKLIWGTCATPLIVDGKLIVNPGGADASVAALDPQTGQLIWKSPGEPAAFSSFIAATLGNRTQVIGYDQKSLGGWDPASGQRLWTLTPPRPNDFNVPTPLVIDQSIVVSTENNGTRVYPFDESGILQTTPTAVNEGLAPDTHSPVVIGNRLFGVWNELYCLDLNDQLKSIWTGEDSAFYNYTALIASPTRLLAVSTQGELLLIDPHADEFRVLSRLKLFDDDNGVYSHPAIVGDRLYIRSSTHLGCLSLRDL